MQKPKIYDLNELMDRFDLTDSGRYNAQWVRRVCEHIKGAEISRATWARWRASIDVLEHRRWFTKGQSLCMMAIAYLRRHSPQARVSAADIRGVLTGDRLTVLQKYLCGEIQVGIMGRDVGRAIAKVYGREWSRATLYRRIPGFSASRVYYAKDIDRMFSVLSKRETETA